MPIDPGQLGQLILDSAVDYAIVTISAEGDVMSWSEGAERILGWTEDEIVGRSADAFFTPEDVAQGRPEAELREAAESGRATDERYHMRRDGTRFYAQGLMMPLKTAAPENGEGARPASPRGFLKIFRDQTQRHEAEQRVRELENSVATVLRASGTIGVFRYDPEKRIVWADASCARMFDLDPEALRIGADAETFFARIHPDDVGRVVAEERRTSETDAHSDAIFRVVRADGDVRWLNTLSDLVDRTEGRIGEADARAARIRSGVMIDVTERRRDERLRTAVLEVGDGLRALDDPVGMARLAAEVMGRTLDLTRAGFGDVDPDGDTVHVTADWTAPGAASLVGVVRYRDFGAFNAPLLRGETVAIVDARTDPRVSDAAPLEAIGAHSLVNMPLMERGRLTAILFVNQDRPREWSQAELDFVRAVFDRTYAAIERVRAVRERELVNRELAHRMKNVLTVAQVIATQSLRHAPSLEAGRAQVAARLTALSHAQDILTAEDAPDADIRTVIEGATSPLLAEPERLTLDGPPVRLGEQQVLGLALAIHELATNAGKYGALSGPEGRIDVSWTLGEDHAFRLTWRETGGPAPSAADRAGFGSVILDRITGSYFGGRSELRLEPGGAVFMIEGRLDASSDQ